MAKSLYFGLLLLLAQSLAAAQNLEFHPPAAANDPATASVMRDLAERIIPVYQDADRVRYLANLSALQLVAGSYAAAYAARLSLAELRRRAPPARSVDRSVLYDIYARARALEVETRTPFAQGFAQSVREVAARLNDLDAYTFIAWLATPPPLFQEVLQKAFDQHRTKDTLSLAEAVDLVWKYLTYDAYRGFGPLVDALAAEDDRRRYVTDEDLRIRTPDGASISAVLVRPKSVSKPLPTLLEFTIYVAPQNYAKECAAHGYAGVVAYVRGKGKNPGGVVPYQHDGDDARAVINWIAKQTWSDGRVGMYGSGYSGFTQWAAAKRPPPALKAMAASAPAAPGIDVPMTGNIFLNASYRWLAQITGTPAPSGPSPNDDARWRALDQAWYSSGKRYRDLDRLAGQPSPLFHRWLEHPNPDHYWQSMIPQREEFSHIEIPVLAITGYYDSGDGGEVGALYYFAQHTHYNPRADATLLIGPYDHFAMQRGPLPVLEGYTLDPAALIDLRELRYQWFDSVFKGGAKPALLTDRVNYQVMGGNEWRHAPSLEAMADGSRRFYLDTTRPGDVNRLTERPPPNDSFLRQTVNFADRSDANWTPPATLVNRSLQPHNELIFVTDPLPQPLRLNGLFSGRLELALNKRDVDLHIALYEQLPGGDYLQLADPPDEFRASFAQDRSHRRLLAVGKRVRLTFTSERLTSRNLQAGSRLVIVLGINKRPDRQINYGTGKDVSDESIADAKAPLAIRWYGGSYIDVPVLK